MNHSERTTEPFNVLLADDDGPSRYFLQAALETLDCQVTACADGEVALTTAAKQHFDLLLLDCRMPGAGALQILQRLRADSSAASHASAAIASSAELDSGLQERLGEAGFANTLIKPLSVQTLREALQPLRPDHATQPLLDHTSALRSSGNAETLSALRMLFVDELKRLRDELDTLARRPADLSERLHPLLASCGFCGASALAKDTRQLKQCADRSADSTSAMHNFRHTLDATVEALADPPEKA